MTLWQNDARWGALQLGNGDSTIGRGGCLLTVLCEAASRIGGRPGLIPPHANETLRKAGCFLNSGLIIEHAAQTLGMESPDKDKVQGKPGDPSLKAALDHILEMGQLAILHVDHDGMDNGDHFILALRATASTVDCIDPALATHVALEWPKLEATVRWGKKLKLYRVVSVRPLRALPQ